METSVGDRSAENIDSSFVLQFIWFFVIIPDLKAIHSIFFFLFFVYTF